MGAFKCENEGVYNEVNDRSPNHEKKDARCALILGLVEVTGFEPMASWSRTKRATKLRYTSTQSIYHI